MTLSNFFQDAQQSRMLPSKFVYLSSAPRDRIPLWSDGSLSLSTPSPFCLTWVFPLKSLLVYFHLGVCLLTMHISILTHKQIRLSHKNKFLRPYDSAYSITGHDGSRDYERSHTGFLLHFPGSLGWRTCTCWGEGQRGLKLELDTEEAQIL